jgi:hypothetical protein
MSNVREDQVNANETIYQESQAKEQEYWLYEVVEEAAERVASLERDLEVLWRYKARKQADAVFDEQQEALDDLQSAIMAWLGPSMFGTCYRDCQLASVAQDEADDTAFEARADVAQAAQYLLDCDGDSDSYCLLADAVVFWCRAVDELCDCDPISPEAGATLATLRLFNGRGRYTMAAFEEANEEVKAELLEMFGSFGELCKAICSFNRALQVTACGARPFYGGKFARNNDYPRPTHRTGS